MSRSDPYGAEDGVQSLRSRRSTDSDLGVHAHPTLPGRGETHLVCAVGHEFVRRGRSVLFTFLAEHYQRRRVVITSNLVLSQWDRIFKDPMTTAAGIDRVVRHALILELTGKRGPRTPPLATASARNSARDRAATDSRPVDGRGQAHHGALNHASTATRSWRLAQEASPATRRARPTTAKEVTGRSNELTRLRTVRDLQEWGDQIVADGEKKLTQGTGRHAPHLVGLAFRLLTDETTMGVANTRMRVCGSVESARAQMQRSGRRRTPNGTVGIGRFIFRRLKIQART